jgi:hypothetical protein
MSTEISAMWFIMQLNAIAYLHHYEFVKNHMLQAKPPHKICLLVISNPLKLMQPRSALRLGRILRKAVKNEVGRVITLKKIKFNDGSAAGSSKTSQLYNQTETLGRKDRHQKLDLAVVKFFCCSGIPTFLAEQNVWKNLLNMADPTYVTVSQAKLEEVHIVGEAENVQQI